MCIHKPNALEEARRGNGTPTALNGFFDLLQNFNDQHRLQPSQIWNWCKKGFDLDPSPSNAVASRQSGIARRQHRQSHGHVTVNVCVNAQGNSMPVQIVYNQKELSPALVSNGPPGAVYSTSGSGSMDSGLFQDWLTKIFLANTSRDKTDVLIMDNHVSYLNVETIDLARKNNVIFLALPPKTTHLLQPLDRAVFCSLDQHYQTARDAARLTKPDHMLVIGDFPKIFTEAYLKAVTPCNILASFEQTGISPFNRNAVPLDALLPAGVRVTSDKQVPDSAEAGLGEVAASSSNSTNNTAVPGHVIYPLAQSMFPPGMIREEVLQLFLSPANCQQLPSTAAQAMTVTADTVFQALQQHEQLEAAEREARQPECQPGRTQPPPAEAVQNCVVCAYSCANQCEECSYYYHDECTITTLASAGCPNCAIDP